MTKVLTKTNSKVYIGAADAAGADLTTEYQSYIEKVGVSGGDSDLEVQESMGGQWPVGQNAEAIEITMDIILALDDKITEWNAFLKDKTTHVVAIQGGNVTDGYYWDAYNNAVCTASNKDYESDGVWKGTVTFKLTAVTEVNATNHVDNFHATADIKDVTDGLLASDWS